MSKSVLCLIPIVTVAIAFSFHNPTAASLSFPDQTELRQVPNPDPRSIIGEAGAQTIKVSPRNSAQDFQNLQWAFDNVKPGGTIALGAGTFFLGDGKDAPRRTVWMRHGLRVIGKKDGRAWQTVIRGGGEVLKPGVGGELESGPIRIAIENDNHPAVFENIWFREWACEVIFIVA